MIKNKTEKIGTSPRDAALQVLSEIIGSNLDLAVNLFNTIPTGISFTTDITCKEIRHNQKSAEFFRIKPWESLSCTASNDLAVKLFHKGKELSPEEMPIQRAAWKAEYVKDFDIEFRWDDGVYKKSIWNSNPLLDKSGSLIGAVASFEDITYLQKAEEALRLSEDKFSKAFHHNQTMMGIMRFKDRVFLDVNDKFAEVLGYRREELIGKSAEELNIGPNPEGRLEIRNQLAKQGFTRDIEGEFRKNEGRTGFGIASYNLLDIDGEKYILISASDITARKRAEEALRLSERLFCKTFNANPLPMAIISLDNDVILDVNEAFLKRGRYTKHELIGLSTTDMGIWVDINERLKLIEEMEKDGFVRNFEVRLSQKPGEIATFLLSGSKITWKGEECLLGIANDITELKQYQK